MKNDIKTKSTDFLPTKPGDDNSTQVNTSTSNAAPATPAAATSANTPKPVGPPMPTSAHVIDLKNQGSEPAKPKNSQDFMVKNNPFLKGTDMSETSAGQQTQPKPADLNADVSNKEEQLPEPPKPAPTESDSTIKTTEDAGTKNTSQTDSPPSVDMAHPEGENDPLKDAMVSHDDQAKPKKKFPTWLLVIVIVIAVIVIAIGTFAVLNLLARPTGI